MPAVVPAAAGARRLARWLALGVLVAAGLAACADAFGVEDVLGVWNTQSINDYPVPGSVVYRGIAYDTEYVRWAFYDGGQCTLTQLVNGYTDTYDDCTYTVAPDQATIAIVLHDEPWSGSAADDTITLTDPQDVRWVLRAQ